MCRLLGVLSRNPAPLRKKSRRLLSFRSHRPFVPAQVHQTQADLHLVSPYATIAA